MVDCVKFARDQQLKSVSKQGGRSDTRTVKALKSNDKHVTFAVSDNSVRRRYERVAMVCWLTYSSETTSSPRARFALETVIAVPFGG